MIDRRKIVKKVSVIGLFCAGRDVADGQSVKTRIVTQELEKALGADRVRRIDTYGWKKNPVKLFFNCIVSVWDSSNVVFMTDEGGIKIFPWLLRMANIFHRRSIHYVVIGGWLVPFLERHRFLASCLRKLDGIFVETKEMQRGLENTGFSNVRHLPNFKNLTPVREDQLVLDYKEPYGFCTFSRVMKEKGIADAVEAVRTVNAQYGRAVCTLDIYGLIDPEQKEWFDALMADFPPEVRYCGVVPFDRSVETLKDYFALLFPTAYVKEGIPGTIIDAYAAGLPVIASKWSGFYDMIDDGHTGIGYPWMENAHLTEILMEITADPGHIIKMKKNCLKKAEDYLPKNLMATILEELA